MRTLSPSDKGTAAAASLRKSVKVKLCADLILLFIIPVTWKVALLPFCIAGDKSCIIPSKIDSSLGNFCDSAWYLEICWLPKYAQNRKQKTRTKIDLRYLLPSVIAAKAEVIASDKIIEEFILLNRPKYAPSSALKKRYSVGECFIYFKPNDSSVRYLN